MKDLSPLHYVVERQAPEVKKPHFDLGDLSHTMILEPDLVNDIAVVPPDDVLSKSGSRAGNKYKDWAAEQGDKLLVTKKQWYDARRIASSVLDNPEHIEAKLLLTSGRSEVSFFYTDVTRNIRIKVRPDHLPGADIVADLKTARTAEPYHFGVDSFKLKYHWSASLTMKIMGEVTGRTFQDYRLIAVESDPPHDVTIHKVTADQLLSTSPEIEKALDTYARCYNENEWPGYEPGTQDLIWPAWAWRQVQTQDEFNPYED